MENKLKIVFAPGCFDSFDGTQEELDELMQTIIDQVESGNFEITTELSGEDDLEDDEIDLSMDNDALFMVNPPTRVIH